MRSPIDFLVWTDERPEVLDEPQGLGAVLLEKTEENELGSELVLTEVHELHRADVHRFDDALGAVPKEDVVHADPEIVEKGMGVLGGRIAQCADRCAATHRQPTGKNAETRGAETRENRCTMRTLHCENPHRHDLLSQVRGRHDGALHRIDYPRARFPRPRPHRGAPGEVRSETCAYRTGPIPAVSLRAIRSLEVFGYAEALRADVALRGATYAVLPFAVLSGRARGPEGARGARIRRGARALGGPERGFGRDGPRRPAGRCSAPCR